MSIKRILATAVIVVLSSSFVYAQEKSISAGGQNQATAKTIAKKKKYSAPDYFGSLHDKAKKDGIDTSKPESLKGDVGGQIARKVKF